MTKQNVPSVVRIPYESLTSGADLSEQITQAFGRDGLGIFLIPGVPNLAERRERILRISQKFATLPDAVKEKYAHPASNYAFGWSHGKEQMKDGKVDTAKGSYYANPVSDSLTDDEHLKTTYPGVYSDNIWPTEDCPEMEPAFKQMGELNFEISSLVNRQLDHYLTKVTEGRHQAGFFEKHMAGFFKSRLLHYFPIDQEAAAAAAKKSCNEDDIDNFCGWHLDHGALTVLLSPMYLDTNGNEVPAPNVGGLFIKNAQGVNVRVTVPKDCLAVQLGELGQLWHGSINI